MIYYLSEDFLKRLEARTGALELRLICLCFICSCSFSAPKTLYKRNSGKQSRGGGCASPWAWRASVPTLGGTMPQKLQ